MIGTSVITVVSALLPLAQQQLDGRPIFTAPPGPPRYVERSFGLQQPALDGGSTEVEVGDVNGDGHPDLVSVGDHGSPFVNTQQHGVMVWFGNGAGDWGVFQYGSFGYGGVAIGDANGDGLLDVGYGVHHNSSGNDLGDQLLEVAVGDGTGRLWAPWDDGLATNGETWGMSATDFADVDGDGDLDVGSVSFGCCAGVHVYLNQGDGTWRQSFGFLGGNSMSAFMFADLDNDGHSDIVVANDAGGVYLGDGTGSFTRFSTGLPGYINFFNFDVGDVEGDGRLELALQVGGRATIWKPTGSRWGQMETRGLAAATNVQGVQLSDMNADGLLDLVSFGGGSGRVYLGDGTGGFFPVAAMSAASGGSLITIRARRDLDHNGRPDIVLVNHHGTLFNTRNKLHSFAEASVARELSARIVAPGPNRVLRSGSVRFVDWLSGVPRGQSSSVSLELSTNGRAGPWTPIASGLPDNGRYQWIVPATTSNSCRLRITVSASAGSVRALSGRFRIL